MITHTLIEELRDNDPTQGHEVCRVVVRLPDGSEHEIAAVDLSGDRYNSEPGIPRDEQFRIVLIANASTWIPAPRAKKGQKQDRLRRRTRRTS